VALESVVVAGGVAGACAPAATARDKIAPAIPCNTRFGVRSIDFHSSVK